jgi:hypothetical protein
VTHIHKSAVINFISFYIFIQINFVRKTFSHVVPDFFFEMGLREIGWDGMDWIYLGQDRDQWRALVNAVMNLRVP